MPLMATTLAQCDPAPVIERKYNSELNHLITDVTKALMDAENALREKSQDPIWRGVEHSATVWLPNADKAKPWLR